MISKNEVGLIVRFLVVGVANTLFSLGVYWLLLYVGLSYQWAAALALILGIAFSFNSHRSLVFKVPGRFTRYVLVWLVVYFVNIALISIVRKYVGDYIAGFILIPVNAFLAYMLMKRFVFQYAKTNVAQ